MKPTDAPRSLGGRVYLDPKDSILGEIDRLVGKLDLRGRKELIAEAVSLYAIFVEEIASGRRAGVMDPNTRDFIRITTPGLHAAEKLAPKFSVETRELVPA